MATVTEKNGEKDKFKKIHPSIFIGLGGTGKHVLLDLRRKLFEKFELKTGFPVMEYLWIDTDMQNVGIDGKELDYTLEQVKFQPDETIDLQIPESTFNSYISYKQDYPHIWEWLPHTIEASGPPKNGAKQIRPLGRLGYFYKYDEIVRKLDFLRSKISSRENVNKTEEMGIQVDASQMDIYVIFSIAGGTGSGTFLDMAFTLKEHFTSGINTIGYVVLPSVFWHDRSHRIFANSYAALKELEYFSLRKDFLNKDEAMAHETRQSEHDFLCWYTAKGKQKKIVGPPFDIVYLIDNQTSQGFTINLENKDQLMDMIAEDIFLQFASPSAYGSIVKSIQSNAHSLLEYHYVFEIAAKNREEQARYKNAYSRHFASMGISKIYIPIDKIRRACSLKYAIRIVENWTKIPDKAPNINDLVEKELYTALKLARGESGKTFVDRINRRAERTFEASVDDWIRKLRQKMTPKFEKMTPNAGKELTDEYEQFFKENIRRDTGRKGIYVEDVEINVANLVKEIQNGVLGKTNEVLDEPGFRFDAAKKMLLHFKERLEFMKQSMEKNRNDMKKQTNSKYERDFNQALTTYTEAERRFNYLKKVTLTKLGEILVKKLRLWLINEARVLLVDGAIAVIDAVSGFVGFSKTEQNEEGEIIVIEEGLVKKLSSVEDVLKKDILGDLQYKYRSFASQAEEHINVPIYSEDLVDSYFEIDGKPIDDEALYNGGKELLTEVGIEMIGLIDYFAEYGKGKLQQSLEVFCAKEFTTIKKKHEAIRMLYDGARFKPDERKLKLGNFIGNGHPWIKPTGSFLGTNEAQLNKDIQKYSVLGVYPGKHESYQHFKKNIQEGGVSLERFQVADSEENVAYFYTEWVAFPIMYIDGIREWYEKAYRAYIESSDENLHIEKYYHKYDELIAISYDDLDKYLGAYETLILGFILGIIDIKEEKERKTFNYMVQWEASPGIMRSRKIGDEYFAIKKLEGISELKTKIMDDISKKKMEMEMDSKKMWDYYALLNYYWKEVFPIRYKGSAADPVEIETFEYRVIENEMRSAGEKLKDIMMQGGFDENSIKQEFKSQLDSRLRNLNDISQKVGTSKRRVIKS